MLKTLAFLETPSTSDQVWDQDVDEKTLVKYRDDQVFHRQQLRRSMTGNRLYQSFSDMFDQIHWDNVAPLGTVDQKHIDRVIGIVEPKLILTFGRVATDAISVSIAAERIVVLSCHHPNARFHTQHDLDMFAMRVRTVIRDEETKLPDES